MRYLLDTNVFIAAMKGAACVRRRLAQVRQPDLVLSPVVLGELMLGVEKSLHREKNAERLRCVTAQIETLPLDASVSECYARLRAELERQGVPIGANDYWIAAHALALGVVLVTDNLSEFKRVPGLVVENWLLDTDR